MGEEEQVDIGSVAVAQGMVSPEALKECREDLALMRARGLELPLAEILLSKGLLSRDDIARLEKLRRALSGERVKLGPFELLAKIGEGGMGAVYKVRDTRTNELAALKILPANYAQNVDFVQRFEREAQILKSLSHPNIVRALDFGRLDYMRTQLPYMAMELVEGETLGERIDRQGAVREKLALEWLADVARALRHADQNGLIHRDIKPDNIFITKEGHAKLGDFGLARNVAETATRITQTGMFMGSVHYSSPEQAEDLKNIDIRSDIYSLGATFYHALTGQVPFEGDTAPAILVMHLSEELPWPGDVNPRVSDAASELIAKMMAKGRKERFQDPTELLRALEGLRSERRARPFLRSSAASSIARSKEKRERVLEKTRIRREKLARRRAATIEAAPPEDAERRKKLLVLAGVGVACAVLLVSVLVILGGKKEPPRKTRSVEPSLSRPRARQEERPEGAHQEKLRKPVSSEKTPKELWEEKHARGKLPQSDKLAPPHKPSPPRVAGARKPAPQTVAAVTAVEAGRQKVPPKPSPGTVVARFDFEDGSAQGWSGRVVEQDGKCLLAARLPPDDKSFSSGAWTLADIAAGKDTRLSFTCFLDRGDRVKVECYDETVKQIARRELSVPAGAWAVLTFNVSALRGVQPGHRLTHIYILGGEPGKRTRLLIDEVVVHEGELPPNAAREVARRKRKRETRERDRVYFRFLKGFRDLLKKRAYEEAARLADESTDERAEDHARDARLLKGYLDRALKNAKKGKGREVTIGGKKLTLAGVEGDRVLFARRVGRNTIQMSRSFARLKPEEVIELAELDSPPDRFAMRGLVHYAEGNLDEAGKQVRGVKGELAERVTRLVTLGRQVDADSAASPPERESPFDVANIRRLFRGQVRSWNPKTLEIMLSYDFEDPAQEQDWSLGGWALRGVTGGSVRARDGVLRMSRTGRCALLSARFTSVSATVEFALTGGDWGDAALLLCADDEGNFYTLFGIQAWRNAYLEEYVAGRCKVLSARRLSPLASARQGAISLSFANGHLKGQVGDLAFEADDTSHASGQVGLWAHDTDASFDNVRVAGELDRAWLKDALTRARLASTPGAPAESGRGLPPPEPEWTVIFNGRDPTGWKHEGGKAYVEDGALVSEENADLFYKADWAEFALSCEINAGAPVRSAFVLALGQWRMGRSSSRAVVLFHADGDVHVYGGRKRLCKCGEGSFPFGRWTRVRLELTRRVLNVYVGERLLGTADVSRLPVRKGGVYFYCYRGPPVQMRNVRVRVISH